MNPSLRLFFKEIATNKELQTKLYHTKEIAEVAVIANDIGYKITPTDVLKAQAGRLIELASNKPEEAYIATAGQKPNLGAQWGREGNGFLEQAGYWLIQLYSWGFSIQSVNQDLTNFLSQINENKELKSQMINCKTFDQVANLAQAYGFSISAIALLTYQALCILSLDEQHADLVAHGNY